LDFSIKKSDSNRDIEEKREKNKKKIAFFSFFSQTRLFWV